MPTHLSVLRKKIGFLDPTAMEEARQRWDSLTKPQGSLGQLETLGTRLAGIRQDPLAPVQRKVIFTAAADHGVVEEGICAYPQEVTQQMVRNFIKGGAAINVLARQVGAEVIVVDAGCVGELPMADRFYVCKVRPGTGNFRREPAMFRTEAETLIDRGRNLFEQQHQGSRMDLVGLGDMGIGNTTASSALTAVFTGLPVEQVVGRGAGLSDEALLHKRRVIQDALALHRPDPEDPVAVLAAIGGFEIAFLTGVTLAAAEQRVPVVLDGFITSVAALVACRIDPAVTSYLIASHRSVEPGHRAILEDLGLEPLLDLKMRLGEGTGAALGLLLCETSSRLMREMATFKKAGVSNKEEA